MIAILLLLAAPLDVRACQSDGDCIVYCPVVKACCSSAPCGCMSAINRKHKKQVDSDYAKTCDRLPRCLDVDCAYKHATTAVCEQNQCVAKVGP